MIVERTFKNRRRPVSAVKNAGFGELDLREYARLAVGRYRRRRLKFRLELFDVRFYLAPEKKPRRGFNSR